ncbi:MAG: VOC family protein [Caulobacteraceae bacterium]
MMGEAEAKRERGLIGQASPMMFKVDDCKKICDELRAKGVKILKELGKAPFGILSNIADLDGNSI